MGPDKAKKANRGPNAGADNRKALILAAREEFSSGGALVPLSRIAKRAGVGQGSLYRHFTDRVDLAAAVFEQNLREAGELVRASRCPYSTFCDVIVEQSAEAAVIIDVVSSAGETTPAARLRSQVEELVGEVHASARESGEIGAHVESRDLLTAVSMLALPLSKTAAEEHEETARRIRRLLDAWFLSQPAPH